MLAQNAAEFIGRALEDEVVPEVPADGSVNARSLLLLAEVTEDRVKLDSVPLEKDFSWLRDTPLDSLHRDDFGGAQEVEYFFVGSERDHLAVRSEPRSLDRRSV